MLNDPKKYFGFTFDKFTELVYTVKIARLSTQPFARLQVTISNGLNARQSEILKSSINLLKVFGVSLEMSSDPKKYFGFTFDEFGEYF